MPQHIVIELDVPDDLKKFRLPKAVDRRLQDLLDRQSEGKRLTTAERREAEGLVIVAELLSLLRLRASRIASKGTREK